MKTEGPTTPGGTPYLRAREMREAGLSPEQIRKHLVNDGLDPESALVVVGSLPDSPVPHRLGKRRGPLGPGTADLGAGVAFIVVGGGIFVVQKLELLEGAPPAGLSLLAFAAVLTGALQILRGLLWNR